MQQFQNPFVSPELKLCWAERRVKELEAELDEFTRSDPLVATVEDIGGRVGVTFKLRTPIPKSVPLTLGDAIHNMRTALDLLACDLVLLNGKSAKGVYFPFSEKQEDLDGQIKIRHFDRASKDVVDLLKSIAPYNEGNALLRALHDLDIQDKHKLITPVINATHVKSITVNTSTLKNLTLKNCTIIGNKIDMALPYGTEIKVDGLSTMIYFDEDTPAPLIRRDVLESLKDLAKLTRGIIETFKSHCEGRSANASGAPVRNDSAA